ncbi:uncharacterized protein LOC110465702 [Mizuhopecten yessoensis]|uniref:Uncharacterized protein n=1 Tax=Mizuhopecten yessoensis TaxID=6573 RepID=A0A210PR43_MIZYE|nr:uncharacterized protein LOC110465702 [Mizuhopecten yessoensis]OWF38934.1 hypothetical protein KP79_PYT07587 [Mizuhopecten yessoensis]
MSTNSTTPAPESDGVVLSGGVIFIIIFGATCVFFFSIMTVVCVGEFKEYRSRRKRPSRPVENGNYPRQPPPLTVPPVTNPTIPGAKYPRQPDSGIDNQGHNNSAVKPEEEIIASDQSNAVNKSVIVSEEGVEGSSPNGDIVVLHQTPRKKNTQLKPLELAKPGTDNSNPETIFSPRTTTMDGVTAVAFIQPTPPLPSISSNISQSDVTPVVSS